MPSFFHFSTFGLFQCLSKMCVEYALPKKLNLYLVFGKLIFPKTIDNFSSFWIYPRIILKFSTTLSTFLWITVENLWISVENFVENSLF